MPEQSECVNARKVKWPKVIRGWRGYAVAAVLAAGVLVPGIPALADAPTAALPTGCTASGNFEACLSDPTRGSDGQDTAIEDRLQQLTKSAVAGDRIRVSIYIWTRSGLAKDLVAASERGVDVRVVMDDRNRADDTAAYRVLAASDIPLTTCVDSCLGSKINHNKFFLFNLNGEKSIVMTSTNLTTSQMGKYNNSLRVIGDGTLYEYFIGYWNRLRVKSWTYEGDTWSNSDRKKLGDLATKAYVYPRTSGDNIVGILNNVTSCRDHDKKIWVSMSLFKKTRSAVRDRLAYMHSNMGCNVKILVQNREDELWVQKGSLPNSKVGNLKLHDKYFLIDAKYNGTWQETVFTGSHNFTRPALYRNDEALVRVEDQFVFDTYRAHYDVQYSRANGR